MWLLRFAVRRPYSIFVLAAALALGAVGSASRMSRDIFPNIDIPVVIVVWNYQGMPAEELERRILNVYERGASATVDGIRRVESQCINGIGILRFYFGEGQDLGSAIAQLAAVAQTASRYMPPGTTPPIVLRFNASNLPVAQVTLTSDKLSEQQIFDYGNNFLRMRLFTIPGLSTPAPYGGRTRQVTVDVDPMAARARGLSAQDVVQALLRSNVITPGGTQRIGGTEFDVLLNNSPGSIREFEAMPVATAGGRVAYLGDVATIHDGFAVQQNVVRVDGRRATYLTILKKSGASTLAVVEAAKEILPVIQKQAPEGLELRLDSDQSVFVRAAIANVIREGLLAAILVGLLVLAFLGSWRGAVIVWTSIPLAVAVGLIGLSVTGQSLNLMTLGGLALTIGILVDDSTVAVENIHRLRASGVPLVDAILRGGQEVSAPALASTLVIALVFSPVILLEGPSRHLFVPLAIAVVFSILGSYVVSRTVVPSAAYALWSGRGERSEAEGGWRARVRARAVEVYDGSLQAALARPRLVVGALGLALVLGALGAASLGVDFFPETDAGQLRLQMRAPAGTRIEETEAIAAKLEQRVREVIPAERLEAIDVNIGIPTFFNLGFVQSDNIGGQDAEVRVALRGTHGPTADLRRRLRQGLANLSPGTQTYFLPADIIAQALNFGIPAPLDVELEAKNLDRAAEAARALRDAMDCIPGAVDVRIPQVLNHPAIMVGVDRTKAAALGISQRDVSTSVLTALSSSNVIAPAFWVNPANGVNYPVAVQVPLERVASLPDLMLTPISGEKRPAYASPEPAEAVGVAPALTSVATAMPAVTKSLITHRNGQRVMEVQAGVEGRDLGGVVRDVRRAIAVVAQRFPEVTLRLRGQGESMVDAFTRLGVGMLLALALVFLVLVVLFQSFIEPTIIIIAALGALLGVVAGLRLTGSTLNVESMMGAVMSLGVGVANSILLVQSANALRMEKERTPLEAMRLAARRRLRPVFMTASAMIVGMIPNALALGDGGEQSAPLGRAVIGGLAVASATTLLLVPVIYCAWRRRPPALSALDARVPSGDGA